MTSVGNKVIFGPYGIRIYPDIQKKDKLNDQKIQSLRVDMYTNNGIITNMCKFNDNFYEFVSLAQLMNCDDIYVHCPTNFSYYYERSCMKNLIEKPTCDGDTSLRYFGRQIDGIDTYQGKIGYLYSGLFESEYDWYNQNKI